MKVFIRILIFVLTVLIQNLFSQAQECIFQDLSGEELRDELVNNYKTSSVLSYDKARDTIFAKIYNHDDSLTCVYTGYTIYIDPAQDPTSYAYQTANFQTEHTWPQSKGAVGQSKSDMHHLFPVRGSVNVSRGNEPFSELLSSLTSTWWYQDTSYISSEDVSPAVVNQCSKRGKYGGFEPREDHKGNVARAMYYFYTMYKTEADSADPDFFDKDQREDLYKWHYQDPPDLLERLRNDLISSHQDDKKNPFILDPTLIRRAYPVIVYKTATGIKYHEEDCQYLYSSKIPITLYEANKQGLSPCSVCDPLSCVNYLSEVNINIINQKLPNDFILNQNFPNPFNEKTVITFTIRKSASIKLEIFNIQGKLVETLCNQMYKPGNYDLQWDGNNESCGFYLYRITNERNVISKKMLLLK